HIFNVEKRKLAAAGIELDGWTMQCHVYVPQLALGPSCLLDEAGQLTATAHWLLQSSSAFAPTRWLLLPQLHLYHRNRTLNFSGEPLERKPRHCICSLQSPEPTHYKITSFSSSDPFLLFSFRHKSEIRGTESHLGVINRCVSFINPNFLAVFSSGSQIFSSINAYTCLSYHLPIASLLNGMFFKVGSAIKPLSMLADKGAYQLGARAEVGSVVVEGKEVSLVEFLMLLEAAGTLDPVSLWKARLEFDHIVLIDLHTSLVPEKIYNPEVYLFAHMDQ
ncbi:hypothetical protein CUMW_015870, partial [Citrus unshiu]